MEGNKPQIAATDRPVFVFSQHRGGGTLLARLLNCHPDLVIWGEHAGFINQMAEVAFILDRYEGVLGKTTEDEFARFLSRHPETLGDYSPWLSPMLPTDFPTWSREFLRVVFSRRVSPGQRWGFKEIRYHKPIVAQYLHGLFPHARFILLTRDPIELCVSNIFVAWSLEGLLETGVQHNAGAIRTVVEDCLYAIVAVQTNMAEIQKAMPTHALSVAYDAVAAAPAQETARIFRFLDLPTTPEVLDHIGIAASHVVGVTDKHRPDLGLLTPALVAATARALLDRTQALIQTDGIDLARLRRLAGLGRYSYLTGDHGLVGAPLSSMF